jgi:hypothetical protein
VDAPGLLALAMLAGLLWLFVGDLVTDALTWTWNKIAHDWRPARPIEGLENERYIEAPCSHRDLIEVMTLGLPHADVAPELVAYICSAPTCQARVELDAPAASRYRVAKRGSERERRADSLEKRTGAPLRLNDWDLMRLGEIRYSPAREALLGDYISTTQTMSGLLQLYREHKDIWTDEHHALAKARKKQILYVPILPGLDEFRSELGKGESVIPRDVGGMVIPAEHNQPLPSPRKA